MDPLYLFVFTKVASTEGFIAVSILILFTLLLKRRIRRATIFLGTTLGLMLSTQVLKETLQVPRPDGALIETVGYALPSGHAAGSLFLALCICYFARTQSPLLRYGVYAAAGIAALAIGISRVDLGVHSPFQVLIGFLLGIVWAGIFVLAVRRY